MQPNQSSRPGAVAFPLLILCALIALALNLRSPLTAIPPVIGQVRADLGIGSTLAGLLTSIPVLCFGILSPAASRIIGRTGIEKAIFITLAGAAIGLVFRPYGGLEGMLGGTLLIGASLAIGNIVSLMVIARDFPQRMGMVTGIYTAALNLGTMLTGAVSAPVAAQIGWRPALAGWVWLVLLAMALWGWVWLRARKTKAPLTPPTIATTTRPRWPLWRRPIVWLLSLAFTLHLFIYYAATAWLPTYLIEVDGMTPTQAGLVASAFQVLSLLGAFGVPALARYLSLGLQLVGMGVLWFLTPLWVILFPQWWPLWSLSGGIAQGGTFVVLFMLIMRHATDLDDNRRLSTVVQGFGYGLAALGPIAMGLAHDLLGRWDGAFLMLSGLSLVLIAAAMAITRTAVPPKSADT